MKKRIFILIKKNQSVIAGVVAFFLIFISLIYFVFVYDDNNDKFNRFISISDFIASILIVISLIVAFFIYLANKSLLPANKVIDKINNMPDFIPFKHALQSNLIPLIKKKHKIIVLLNDLNKENYQFVISQLVVYNDYINFRYKKFFKDKIEFYLVPFNEKSESNFLRFLKSLQVEYYSYYIIASVSSIFARVIKARDSLDECAKENIKVIGTLSSISEEIEEFVNSDNNIIRVFPPDYDEAKSGIDFLFSRIFSLDFNSLNSSVKANIVVLYNRTYGKAVAKQSRYFFDINLDKFKLFLPENLNIDINFISAEYNIHKSHLKINQEDTTLKDLNENVILEDILKRIEDSKNYFFIIGYEPNISYILKRLDKIIKRECKHSILICGTASMSYWRETIINSLKSCKKLNKEAYYLKLKSYNVSNKSFDLEDFNLDIRDSIKKRNGKVNIIKKIKDIEPDKAKIDKIINNNQNYISLYTKTSLDIVRYSIKSDKDLLFSKKIIFEEMQKRFKVFDTKMELLVNGDSINKYTPQKLF